MKNGGLLIAEVIAKQGVSFVFTLCGGHISPILSGCKSLGVRVIDVRHEVNAVFAADAVSRLTGVPGVAAVTAGPGLTNTLTAVKNAFLAQSPLVLLGGSAATVLKGRGSLQDIDQVALMKPHVKWMTAIKKLTDIVPALEKAFYMAKEGVPGPVFVECPIDLLYDEDLVREWYGAKNEDTPVRNFQDRVLKWYLRWHVGRMFANADKIPSPRKMDVSIFPTHTPAQVAKVTKALEKAVRPVMVLGSQVVLQTDKVAAIAEAVGKLGVPVYLSGMARGLLGKSHELQYRHKRKNALREADLVILAGVPCDFRLDYGRHISGKATYIGINRSKADLKLNRKPDISLLADPGGFLIQLANQFGGKEKWPDWKQTLQKRDLEREEDIDNQAKDGVDGINPIALFRKLNPQLAEKSILVADGGDFVATGAYTLQPRGPLSWLDPGVFGTLGVGAGFALGAKLVRPDAEVWIIWGDGSCGYSIAEYDTFVRHNVPVISVVGNDGCWAQIARDQVEILKDDVACMLTDTDYDLVARGFGGGGVRVDSLAAFEEAVSQAKIAAANGKPFLINAVIGKTDFRKGSISM